MGHSRVMGYAGRTARSAGGKRLGLMLAGMDER
jgi:hypothetical protein